PLALLAAVTARLPGVHGALITRVAGRPASLGQPAVAIAQQGLGELREPEVEDREDEQLVPEDVAPVCLAVQAAGRNSRVEVDAVLGDRLQQMKQVQPDDAQCLVVALDLDAGPLPEARPGPDVPVEQLVEAPHPGDAACRCHGWLTDGAVPGSEDGNHLVDGDRLAAADVDGEIVADPAWLGCRAPADAQRPVLA